MVAVPPGELPAIFFPLKLVGVFNLFAADEKQQRLADGNDQKLHRAPLNRRADDAGDRSVNIDLARQGRGIDDVGWHQDDFQFDALVFVEALMISDLERQVADVGFGNPNANLLRAGLRMCVGCTDS